VAPASVFAEDGTAFRHATERKQVVSSFTDEEMRAHGQPACEREQASGRDRASDRTTSHEHVAIR
jgi:hypothetical protein